MLIKFNNLVILFILSLTIILRKTTGQHNNPSAIEVLKCTEYKKQVYETVKTFSYFIHGAEEFKITVDTCKTFSPLIVGGTSAEAKEFPHAARIGCKENRTDIKWVCGGTLISEKYVLTAAHCLFSVYGGVEVVRLGELDFNSQTDDAQPEDFGVKRSIEHPKYKDGDLIYHDIALIELDRSVVFNKYIHPACLTINNGNEFSEFIAIGWGNVAFTGVESSILRKVTLQRYQDEVCRSRADISAKDILRFGLDVETQLCAGSKMRRDTCNGDSGGPLLAYHSDYPCMHYVVGITSFGIANCGHPDLPAVYTRVYNYLDWIRNIVWPIK